MHEQTTDVASPGVGDERILGLEVLGTLGITVPKTARILDFGCGAGATMRALQELGYANTVGYDVADGRSLVESEHTDIRMGTLLDLELPYEDDTFDLVLSDQVFEHVQDQVRAFQEIYRVTKPGGDGLHIIPARYAPIEGHIYVPFGGVLQHRWWYKLWASLGIRNEFQQDLSADETADHNALFVTEATRYVSNSCYRVVWNHIGFQYRFAEQEFLTGHRRSSMRLVGRGGRPATWLYRTFRSRVVHLHKPA